MDRIVKKSVREYPDGIFLALAGMVSGTLLAWNGVPLALLVLIPLVLSLLCALFGRRFLVFTSFILVSGLLTFQQVRIPRDHIIHSDIEKIENFSGKILQCREGPFGVRYAIMADGYVLKDGTVKKARGKVRITSGRTDDIFSAGALVAARGVSLHEIRPPKNPGEEGFGLTMRRQGFLIEGKAREVVLLSPPGNRIKGFFVWIRNRLNSRLDRQFMYFPEEKVLLEAITVGKDNIPYFLREIGRRSGTYHILVVSGQHLAFLLLFLRIVFIFFRNLNNRRPKLFPSISQLVLWMYAGITGFMLPVARAVLMMTFFFLGEIFERDVSGFQSISLAAILLLLLNPLNLFDVSFQLSFAATAGILFFAVRYGFLTGNSYVRGFVASCAGAQIAVLPLIIYHFGTFYPIGLINNVIFIPLAGVIMLSFPLFLFLPFLFFPLRLLLSLFLRLASLSSHVSHGVEVSLPLAAVLVSYLLLFLLFSRMEIRKRLVSCSLAAFAMAGIIFFPVLFRQNAEDRLYLFSMNKPAAIFVKKDETTAFLSDSCRQRNLENVLMPFFREKRISRLSGLFYTDISYDHTGTLKTVREKLRVERIFEHEAVKESAFYPYLSVYFYNNGDYNFILKKNGDRTAVSGLQAEFLGEENGKLAYLVRKGNVHILVAPFLGQEISEKIENRRFDIAWISDMKNTVKVKRLVETAQFDYLVLPKDLKKFKNLKSAVRTFYLSESAVIADFSARSPAVSYYMDMLPPVSRNRIQPY